MTNLGIIILSIALSFGVIGMVSAFAVTPDAIPDSTITLDDRDILIDVLANDVDADGDDLYLTDTTSPDHGLVHTIVEVLEDAVTFDHFVLGDVEKSDTVWYATNDHVNRDGYLYNEGTLIWEFEGHQIRSISVEPGEGTVYVLTNLFDNPDNLGSIFRVDVNNRQADELVSGISFLRAVFYNPIDGLVYYCKPSPDAGFYIIDSGTSRKIAGPSEGVSDCDNGFVDKDGTIVFATHSQNSVKRFDGRIAVELFTIPQSGVTFSRAMDVQRDSVGNYYVAAPDISAVVAVSADGADKIDLITELRFPDRLEVDGKSIYVKTAGVSQLFSLFEYLEYMPDSGYTGPDSFTYTVTDGSGSDTATVGIQIEPDSDFDGLQDSLDVDPLPSPDFDNGHGWGTILSGQDSVIVTDEDTDGVRIFANDSVEVSICGGIETVTLGQLDEILVRCGSATVEVLQGTVEVVFIGDDGTQATATLTEGDNVTFNADTFTFVNDGDNAVVISVDNGETIVLEPDSGKDNPCDALEHVEKQGNGKKKGIERAKQNNDCE